MKNNSYNTFKLSSAFTALCLFFSPLALAENVTNEEDVEQDRWFEIEVILFKQNTNPSQNTEEFYPRNIDYKKQRAIDLLAPYLQPNIASLKQRLPSCEQGSLDIDKPASTVDTPAIELWVNTVEVDPFIINSTNPENSLNQEPDIASNSVEVLSNNMSVSEVKNSNEQTDNSENSLPNDEASESMGKEQQAANLEDTYQAKYADIVLENYNQYPSTFDKGLCVIPGDIVKSHLTAEQLKGFNVDGFPVETQPIIINGVEQWQDNEEGEITWASDSSYLISQDSFKLKSIANRIKRSRNYKPLLHLGWRQVGESRRQAKSVRLYAGDNLSLDYQQALVKHYDEQGEMAHQALLAQQDQDREDRLTAVLNNAQPLSVGGDIETQTNNNNINVTNNANAIDNNALTANVLEQVIEDAVITEELSIEEKVRQHAKQQQLNAIFEQYILLTEPDSSEQATNENSGNTLTASIIKTPGTTQQSLYDEPEVKRVVDQLSADINAPKTSLVLSATDTTIEAPSQPWYLDGIFKVHLDHYLYINSEFNIVNNYHASPVTVAKKQKFNEENNVINFKQDRRVITGEIHYFDHPNMGMIVQIRRFDPTKPADEAVSQSKK